MNIDQYSLTPCIWTYAVYVCLWVLRSPGKVIYNIDLLQTQTANIFFEVVLIDQGTARTV